jgi:ubiquinone/menaquinone biosynthesis C-methylase UbiE
MTFGFRDRLFRIWYWYISRADKNAEILFMNYGFSEPGNRIPLDENNEPDRYSIQLYHHLACATELKNRDIVEIGCGRGGGLSYIAKAFSPATAVGIDLDAGAVAFCKRHYATEGLSFRQGNAMDLRLESNSCDAVFNVESSHRYPDMKAFLGEVSRILRPGGSFLFTDFRYDHEMEELKRDLEGSGLAVRKERCINPEVLAALELDDERKRKLVKKLVPRFLHRIALNFAGTVGSKTWRLFASRKYIYFSFVMQKP